MDSTKSGAVPSMLSPIVTNAFRGDLWWKGTQRYPLHSIYRTYKAAVLAKSKKTTCSFSDSVTILPSDFWILFCGCTTQCNRIKLVSQYFTRWLTFYCCFVPTSALLSTVLSPLISWTLTSAHRHHFRKLLSHRLSEESLGRNTFIHSCTKIVISTS